MISRDDIEAMIDESVKDETPEYVAQQNAFRNLLYEPTQENLMAAILVLAENQAGWQQEQLDKLVKTVMAEYGYEQES